MVEYQHRVHSSVIYLSIFNVVLSFCLFSLFFLVFIFFSLFNQDFVSFPLFSLVFCLFSSIQSRFLSLFLNSISFLSLFYLLSLVFVSFPLLSLVFVSFPLLNLIPVCFSPYNLNLFIFQSMLYLFSTICLNLSITSTICLSSTPPRTFFISFAFAQLSLHWANKWIERCCTYQTINIKEESCRSIHLAIDTVSISPYYYCSVFVIESNPNEYSSTLNWMHHSNATSFSFVWIKCFYCVALESHTTRIESHLWRLYQFGKQLIRGICYE